MLVTVSVRAATATIGRWGEALGTCHATWEFASRFFAAVDGVGC